jgi:hypothetical protein
MGDLDQRDGLIVILAGHGLSHGKCYNYVLYGATFAPGRDITSEGVGCDLLERLMGNVQAGKKALFIDTCESAAAVGSVGVRGEDAERESTIERLSKAAGHSNFTAARDAAYEDSQLGYGLLTYAVLQAVARPGPRGDVDADAIKLYVEDEVPRLSQRWYHKGAEGGGAAQRRVSARTGTVCRSARGRTCTACGQVLPACHYAARHRRGHCPRHGLTQRGGNRPAQDATRNSGLRIHPSGWALIGAGGKKIG